MAPVIPDPRRIKSFKTEAAFERWLAAHHDKEPEIVPIRARRQP